MTLYLVICSVSLLVSALTLFSGFGLGTLLLPAFALFFPLHVAIAATAVVHLANNFFKLFLVGRHAEPKTTTKFAIPAAAAALLGAFVLAELGKLSPMASYEAFGRILEIQPIKLIIGLVIAFFSLFELLPSFQKMTVDPKWVPLGGLLSGFFGGLSGLQGALRSLFLIRAGLTKEQFVGTGVVSSIVVDVTRLIVYGKVVIQGHFAQLGDENAVGPVLAGSISALVGSVLGTQLLKKTTLGTVQKIVGIALMILSVALIFGIV